MFPTIPITPEETTQTLREQIISTSTEIGNTPLMDFKTKSIILSNGSPKMTYSIEAIRQWIVLFVTTPKDVYKIYEGTGFGTSIRKLFGFKRLNNGYEESEVEREIREGLPLCPAINRVVSFNLEKDGKLVLIKVKVELYDGTLIDETVDVSYMVK